MSWMHCVCVYTRRDLPYYGSTHTDIYRTVAIQGTDRPGIPQTSTIPCHPTSVHTQGHIARPTRVEVLPRADSINCYCADPSMLPTYMMPKSPMPHGTTSFGGNLHTNHSTKWRVALFYSGYETCFAPAPAGCWDTKHISNHSARRRVERGSWYRGVYDALERAHEAAALLHRLAARAPAGLVAL